MEVPEKEKAAERCRQCARPGDGDTALPSQAVGSDAARRCGQPAGRWLKAGASCRGMLCVPSPRGMAREVGACQGSRNRMDPALGHAVPPAQCCRAAPHSVLGSAQDGAEGTPLQEKPLTKSVTSAKTS